MQSVHQTTYAEVKADEFQELNVQNLVYEKDLYFSRNSKIVNLESLDFSNSWLQLLIVGQDTAIYHLSIEIELKTSSTINITGNQTVQNYFYNYGNYAPLPTMSRLEDRFVQGYWS